MAFRAAAAITTGVVLAAFPGGLVGGWLAERTGARRELAAVFMVLSAGCVAAILFAPVALLILDLIALGFFDGVVFSILYLDPNLLSRVARGGAGPRGGSCELHSGEPRERGGGRIRRARRLGGVRGGVGVRGRSRSRAPAVVRLHPGQRERTTVYDGDQIRRQALDRVPRQ